MCMWHEWMAQTVSPIDDSHSSLSSLTAVSSSVSVLHTLTDGSSSRGAMSLVQIDSLLIVGHLDGSIIIYDAANGFACAGKHKAHSRDVFELLYSVSTKKMIR